MKRLTASLVASICGLLGHWLLQCQHNVAVWAGLGSDRGIRAGGTWAEDEE